MANTLQFDERHKRSTRTNTLPWLGFLSALPIRVDTETNDHARHDIVSLARSNPSAYDANHLELAMRLGQPLAALDDRLNAAALAVGVPRFDAR